MSGATLTKTTFWWGVSLAPPPALVGLPAVWYAGTALVDMLWRLFLGRDSSEGLAFLGGIVYGLAAGLLLQCFVVGTAARMTRQLSWLSTSSRGMKIALWLAAEIAVIPLSVIMTTAAYAAPVLLAWMLSPMPVIGDGGSR